MRNPIDGTRDESRWKLSVSEEFHWAGEPADARPTEAVCLFVINLILIRMIVSSLARCVLSSLGWNLVPLATLSRR